MSEKKQKTISLVKIFKIWMVDENKNWTLTDVVFNVHRGRTYGNLNKEERVKDLYGGMVFYLKVVKKKKKCQVYIL